MSDSMITLSGESLERELSNFRDAVVKATLDAVDGVPIRPAFDNASLTRFGPFPQEYLCIRIREMRDALALARLAVRRSVSEGARPDE